MGLLFLIELEQTQTQPTCCNINPALPQKLGKINLENFIASGAPLIEVNPPYDVMRKLNFLGFKHVGFPYFGWLTAIHTAVYRIAQTLILSLFFMEDGELEYGGVTEKENKIFNDVNFQKKYYLANNLNKILEKSNLKRKRSLFFYISRKNK